MWLLISSDTLSAAVLNTPCAENGVRGPRVYGSRENSNAPLHTRINWGHGGTGYIICGDYQGVLHWGQCQT